MEKTERKQKETKETHETNEGKRPSRSEPTVTQQQKLNRRSEPTAVVLVVVRFVVVSVLFVRSAALPLCVLSYFMKLGCSRFFLYPSRRSSGRSSTSSTGSVPPRSHVYTKIDAGEAKICAKTNACEILLTQPCLPLQPTQQGDGTRTELQTAAIEAINGHHELLQNKRCLEIKLHVTAAEHLLPSFSCRRCLSCSEKRRNYRHLHVQHLHPRHRHRLYIVQQCRIAATTMSKAGSWTCPACNLNSEHNASGHCETPKPVASFTKAPQSCNCKADLSSEKEKQEK